MKYALSWSALVAASLFLAACGASNSPGNGDGGGGGSPTGDPLLITRTLDESRTVTQLVSPDGATLTTEAADGTRYTLAIPPDGLTQTREISMTPIESVEGFPLSGGFLGGVHFEPQGLFFATPALLTIEPARQVPIESHITFAARGDGEAYLYPIEPSTANISVQIRHFSDYGAGSGTESDRSSAASHSPSRAADRIMQNMAQANDYLRREIINFDEWLEFFEQASRQYYQQVIEPKMDHAEAIAPNGNPADLHVLSDAIAEFLGWERQLQLLGYETFMQAERESLMAQTVRITQKFYAAVYDRCVEKHDLSVIGLLIGLERQMQLLGIEYAGSFSDCLRFELEFDSTMVNEQDFFGSTAEEFQVFAAVPISFDGTTFTGTGPLDYVRFSASGWIPGWDERCQISAAGTAGSTFLALSLEIVHAVPGQVPEVVLTMDPGSPTEFTNVDCSSGSFVSDSHEWLRFWRVNHAGETESWEWYDEPVRTIVDWEYIGGEVLAEKRYVGDGTLSNGNLTAVETTILTLRHTPVASTKP